MTDLVYWIWLSLALDPSSRAFKNLISRYQDPEQIFRGADLSEVEGLNAREKEHLSIGDLTYAESIAEYCFKNDIHILTYYDARYPRLLAEISDPPVLLYVKGTVPDWNVRPCIAVIGTRAMTYYGGEATFDISYDLAKMGCITVSGLALGVDGVCAASSLQAGGTTVAVLGSGIDVIYPAEHAFLYECIVRNGGAVISEFSPKARPEKHHFPIRNRIISGLSRAAIVIEGEAGSGSMITARRAMAQGRSVFAVPGRVGTPTSEAPLLLLKSKKADAITCADDIYDRYREDYLPYINAFKLLEKRSIGLEAVMEKYRVVCARPKEKRLPKERAQERVNHLETHRKNSPTYRTRSGAEGLVDKIRAFLFPGEHTDESKDTSVDDSEEIARREHLMMQDMSDDEKKIYKQMPYGEQVHPDAILLDERSTEEIISILTLMEMKGYVLLEAGGLFSKKID